MIPAPVCYDGSPVRSPRRQSFRAGPLSLEYGDGELRYVRFGEREVLRRVYVAVRDSNWGTVPGRIDQERIESGRDWFRIRFEMEHRAGEIDFVWSGSIDGDVDGSIRFRMDGQARTTFRRNRIGFCVLHPIRECAGAPCRYERENDQADTSVFPAFIEPWNPFLDLRRLAHEVAPDLWAELEFEGDLFEMEDQRNWIDASFKTFCTPLRLPFPMTVAAGDKVRQSVSLLKMPRISARVGARTSEPEITVCGNPVGPLPEIGLGLASDAASPSPREAARLRVVRPAHLRIDLNLSDGGYPAQLARAIEYAKGVDCGLEVALTVTDRAEDELTELVGRFSELRPPVRRWLLFHETEWATSSAWIRLAREQLATYDPAISLVSGSKVNFTELNRNRPPVDLLNGLCYSIHPQEHASDNTSLVETCEAIRDTLRTAYKFSGGLPIAVTPITLRRRVNPYATGPVPPASSEELPPRVDPRQMSLLGAGWTLGSLKFLAWGGAASTTWYETVGWLGVMEAESGCPRPDLFPSRPGMVFPLYHVLADANERPGAKVMLATSNQPLVYEVLALRSPEGLRVLLANLNGEPRTVVVSGLAPTVRVRTLDETTFEQATMAPEEFRADPGLLHEATDGRLELDLKPYAYVRIDSV